jgi:glucokinase
VLRGRVANVTNAVVAELSRPFVEVGPDGLWRQIEQLLVDLLEHQAVRGQRMLGIGVSVPGTVDEASGTIVDSTHLRVKDFALGPQLQTRFGLPVFIEHDTAAAALAELHHGAGRGETNLVYITVSSGIGAGIIVGGAPYPGEGGAAGELGHIIVERDGQICPCGRRGCLETVASGPAIVASAQRILDQGGSTPLREWVLTQQERLSVALVARAAAQGDSMAQAIFARAADYLGLALSTLVCILDIRRIIVGGEIAEVGAHFFDPLYAAIHRYELSSNIPHVIPAALGADAACIGVSMVTLQHLISHLSAEPALG